MLFVPLALIPRAFIYGPCGWRVGAHRSPPDNACRESSEKKKKKRKKKKRKEKRTRKKERKKNKFRHLFESDVVILCRT